MTMPELMETRFRVRPAVIDGLLPAGTYLLAGAPETNCQGLFNQIHKKATKKVPEADFSS